MIIYLIKVSLALATFLAFYKLFLEKESFFASNRIYLIGCLVLSFSLPFTVLPEIVKHQGLVNTLIRVKGSADIEHRQQDILGSSEVANKDLKNNQYPMKLRSKVEGLEESSSPIVSNLDSRRSKLFNLKNQPLSFFITIIYLFGLGVLLINLIAQLFHLYRRVRNSQDKIVDGNCVIVNVDDHSEPTSFGRYIFINPKNYDNSTYEQVLLHEKIHVRKGHTVDLILAELSVIVLWFNPFAWLYRKEIERIIEYQTDDLVLNANTEIKESYQLNLVNLTTQNKPIHITTNYNQSLIKQRILRMNTPKSNGYSYYKYAFMGPILLVLVLFLNNPQHAKAQNPTAMDLQSEDQTVIALTHYQICDQFADIIKAREINSLRELLKTANPNCMGPSYSFEGGFDKDRHVQVVFTPLSFSASLGDIEIASILLEAGADIDSCDVYMKSPLMAACAKGHFDMVKYLISQGADVNKVSGNHGSALHFAVKKGDMTIVKYLMDYGADMNSYTYAQGNPLNSALSSGNIEIADLLLDSAAVIAVTDNDHRSSMDRAAWRGDIESINYLLSKGASVNEGKWSALFSAARNGQTEVVELLLSKGAEIDHMNNDEDGTALITAARWGRYKTVQLLLIEGAKVDLLTDYVDVDFTTRNYKRTHFGQRKVDFETISQSNALHVASKFGNDSIVDLLLDHGADINFQTVRQGSPLIVAARTGNLSTVQTLLSREANIDYESKHQGSALNAAARNGHARIVALLISKGAIIDNRNIIHGTALNAAARNNHINVLEILLDKDVDVNFNDVTFGTAMNAAARNGNLDAVKLLLSYGADLGIQSTDEGLAIDAARRNAHYNVSDYLENLEAEK